jgi:RNA-directed DNA polymerase
VVLYIERWLKAPVQETNGELVARERGTPRGGVISPLLAKLLLHYALDKWLERTCPNNPFERYADDGVVHCRSRAEAEDLRRRIGERLAECGLELNEQKARALK